MRKLLLGASALIPTMLLAGSLAAQSPLPQDQSPRGASPSTQAPGGGAGSRTEQPATNQRMPDASGGERAQNQTEMPRQKSGAGASEEMKQQGKSDSSRPARTQDAQKPEEGTPKRNAQKPEEGAPKRDAQRQEEGTPKRDAQRPDTENPNRDAQRRPEGGTEQRAGKSGSDVETTGSVGISTEKRTTIRETITREHVTPIRDVNFSVNVGVAIPRTVELRVLPPRVVEIVPQYRSYRYFVLDDGRIVIVEPESYKIVYVIAA